jgi:hypothetical protein
VDSIEEDRIRYIEEDQEIAEMLAMTGEAQFILKLKRTLDISIIFHASRVI